MNDNIFINDAKNKSPIFAVQCSICGKCHPVAFSTSIDDIIKELNNVEWKYINDSLYCKECYAQYDKIKNISTEIYRSNIRPTKHNYYLNIAKEVASRSTCLRKRYGSVIVKNDIIISTGYNGAPRQTKNCIDLNYCRRVQMGIPRGQCYELCRSVHSEMNAIINAEREKMIDSTLYLYGCNADGILVENLDSCQMCKKIIINAGIKNVVFARSANNYKIVDVKDWIINDETLTDKMGY